MSYTPFRDSTLLVDRTKITMRVELNRVTSSIPQYELTRRRLEPDSMQQEQNSNIFYPLQRS